MSSPFPEQVAPGGILVYPQIQSPNYVPGVSGWAIFRNGNVEFNAGTFRGFIVGGSLFIYSGAPALGNPPIAWITSATSDPFGNTIQPGIFLAELVGSGNSLGGLMWNTVAGSQPLLALFPDSTVGFTGHSPFVLGQVFNRGAANEQLALALGGGAGSGVSSPVMQNLFSVSKDATLPAHITWYGGASGNQMGDLSQSGLTVVNQLENQTYRAGHLIAQGTMTPGSPQTINSTTGQQVNGLGPFNVVPGSYRLRGHFQFAGNQAAGSPAFQFILGGGAVASKQYGTGMYFPSGGTTVGTNARTGSMLFQGPTMITTESGVIVEAFVTITTGGTITVQALTSVAADTFAIHNANFQMDPV